MDTIIVMTKVPTSIEEKIIVGTFGHVELSGGLSSVLLVVDIKPPTSNLGEFRVERLET
jgi:hypothetical protein